MIKDAILEELRRHRRDIEAENNNDPRQYHTFLLRVQEQYKDRVVTIASHVSTTNSNVASR